MLNERDILKALAGSSRPEPIPTNQLYGRAGHLPSTSMRRWWQWESERLSREITLAAFRAHIDGRILALARQKEPPHDD